MTAQLSNHDDERINMEHRELMMLADAYANASFDQGLHQRTEDPKPEQARMKLLEAIRAEVQSALAAEREKCARLCDWLPIGTGLQGKTFAEAIRGTGMGGELAKGFES